MLIAPEIQGRIILGNKHTVKCRNCGYDFMVSEGGGFIFHLLHCDRCGKDKSISFAEIGEAHLKYLKGMAGPYCIATMAHDKDVQDNYPGEAITEQEYHQIVEELLGECKCGGHYRFTGKPRCPKCKSEDLEDIEGTVMFYD